ncbi:MAG: NUDIX domain-containing protein [Candidatus Kerfeldbacteria bacterium]|nr:NUDIX domain-containing protein [Candidatus Kerfeldbacteria bacterium]
MKKIQMIVAQGIIINNNKVLIGLRNSPHDFKAHKLWQLPAGEVEFAEHPAKAVTRELKEETGYKVTVIKSLPHIENVLWKYKTYQAQVVVLTYACQIIGGKLMVDGRENSEWKWITEKDYKKLKFTPGSTQALKWWFNHNR